jgi:transcription elongation GreA/GreB family factor
MGFPFLQHDYDRLVLLVKILEDRKADALALIGAASTQSSETWHDNPVFDDVHLQAKMWENRRTKLTLILRGGEIVSTSEQIDIVAIGNIVRYRIVKNGLEDEVFIGSFMHVGDVEETSNGVEVASAGSPIGSSLLGHKVGDSVTVKFPIDRSRTERTMQLEILEISLPSGAV